MRTRVASGVLSLVAWFALFAAGVTIDSSPYRAVLASIGGAPVQSASVAPQPGVAPSTLGGGKGLTKWEGFVGTMLFYTPLNVALLTICAGLVGGCASSITYSKTRGAEKPPSDEKVPEGRTIFRTENPVASMLRSFLVYLAFIAGIFITTNDPFWKPTPDQYVRLAGSLSFFAFVVGYDPTRFQDILSLRSRSGGKP